MPACRSATRLNTSVSSARAETSSCVGKRCPASLTNKVIRLKARADNNMWRAAGGIRALLHHRRSSGPLTAPERWLLFLLGSAESAVDSGTYTTGGEHARKASLACAADF